MRAYVRLSLASLVLKESYIGVSQPKVTVQKDGWMKTRLAW